MVRYACDEANERSTRDANVKHLVISILWYSVSKPAYKSGMTESCGR